MGLLKLEGFDERVRRHSWTGNVLPVPYQGERGCRRCSVGILVRVDPSTQLALFYHGGYGAAVRETCDVCLACGHVSVAQVESLNPRRVGPLVWEGV